MDEFLKKILVMYKVLFTVMYKVNIIPHNYTIFCLKQYFKNKERVFSLVKCYKL